MVTIELVAHMDAGDRRRWSEDQDLRTLSELGRRQAERMAAALADGPVDRLYSSPALRCRQTLEPLAKRYALPIVAMPELREHASPRHVGSSAKLVTTVGGSAWYDGSHPLPSGTISRFTNFAGEPPSSDEA
jgi:8-oxo-dGTP diphosphatase